MKNAEENLIYFSNISNINIYFIIIILISIK